jgi:ribosomal protein L29
MLTLNELKKLSEQELKDEFAKASKDLFKTRFEVRTGSSKANHEISKLRKYRAQIKTIQNELERKEKAESESLKEK